MKKIIYIATAILMLASCDNRYDEYKRLLPSDNTVPVPEALKVTDVTTIAGGAYITVEYPDDDNIRGAIATYERNGVKVNTKISRYTNVLKVEGFPDTKTREIRVASFNVNEEQSEPVILNITPLLPAIRTVKPSVEETFGGVKVLIEGNEAKADLAVCILRDADLSDSGKPLKDMKWVEVTTLFTASNNIKLVRRNLQPVEAIFGVYIRDHYGNVSDTTVTRLTPVEEYKLDHSKFSDANLPDDNCKTANASYYPVKALWDDSGASSTGHFFASDYAPRPCWLTIKLGQKARLSRVHTLPRIDYNIWKDAHPRLFEFWGWTGEEAPQGVENPFNPHAFEDGWVLLGEFEQVKPSGYEEDGSVGSYTAEDRQYFNDGSDFEFDPEIWEHANDPITYLRVVFVDNFQTYKSEATSMAVQIGEITPFGKVVE